MWQSQRSFVCLVAAAFVVALLGLPSPAVADGAAGDDLVVVLDASGSMWGRLGGEPKIVVARRVLGELAADLPDVTRVGLVAYGHRRKGDCADVETVLPLAPLDRDELGRVVEELDPKGMTPITASLQHAFGLVRQAGSAVSVVLVSDGLETCDGDPCAAVRTAKAEGVDLLLHVVGFDVADEDVSSLECAAQAGGGLYLDAADADALAAALERAVELGPETPAGRLVLTASADGTPADVAIRVTAAADGSELAGARTYRGPDTNPRALPLPAGRFTVEVEPVAVAGAETRRFEIELAEGETVEHAVEYATGELAVTVTRNGEPSDATVRVLRDGAEVTAGRTYRRGEPRTFRLAAGSYDVVLGSVEIAGGPEHRMEGVEVPAGGRAERSHDYASGELAVGAVRGGDLVDAVVRVLDDDRAVAQGRTYTAASSNPKRFELPPGTYRITVRPVKLRDLPEQQRTVTVEAGGEVTLTVDFATGED